MLERLTASLAGGGMMLAGLPLALDYVVRPGDTLSEIAQRHDTSVERLVERNDLDGTGDRIVAGETLTIPAAHGRPTGRSGSVLGAREEGSSGHGPDRRRIVGYTVRPGDTPSGLAVRFHAWTDEIVERNGAVLRAGERIEIPVVPQAGERRTPARAGNADRRSEVGPSRATVRRVVAATARRHGVDPALALAVSWQEAGWQMHPVSGAGAIGAMQVMPSTGRWMEGVVGRSLDLRDLHDNASAGVALLAVLLDQASTRQAVAGYYQGLAGVRRHGMYDDTRRYVANVLALRTRIAAGDHPG
ncbi:lytic transglycosylase [Nocardioides pakistanensis]